MSYDVDDFQKTMEFLDLERNTEGVQIDGEEETRLLPGINLLKSSLVAMEVMCREIEFSKDTVGFEIKRNRFGHPVAVPKANTMRHYNALKAFFRKHAVDERYDYSLHVTAIREAFELLGLRPLTYTFGAPGSLDSCTSKTHGEMFNDVVAKVAEIVESPSFKKRLRARERNAERNEKKGLAIEQKVFEAKSRQLVLMLHFGYQEQYREQITLDEIQAHRKKFFNNRRMNTLLQGIVDYIWKLEEGDESGLHLHVLLFYKAADSCRDVYIAKQIGEYWVKLTGGKGQYWNSNADKLFHAKYGHGVGTGEIDWNDEPKRRALRQNIRYMTKAEQFLKVKYESGCHLFGTSEVKEKKKSGRPRSVKPKLGAAGDTTQADSLDETGLDPTNSEANQND
ncbi:inovirus-type Gp2 protein [Cupriavidus necator]|uniref:hypothetical protein n=1 Tax=Cupriavidus necator TaxID=106590 RepID=UPI003ECFA229